MNGVPEPFEIQARVVVASVEVVIVDRAPNGEDWRYIGLRADLSGHQIHFSHHEATPVRPSKAPSVRGLLARAGLDPEIYAQEITRVLGEERTPLQDLLDVVREVAHGHGGQLDIRQAWIQWTEESA